MELITLTVDFRYNSRIRLEEKMTFTHSIMFHHFHNEKHRPAQGSLSSADFSEMLKWLGNRYNLMGAQEYLKKFSLGSLAPGDICLSFDDGLLCQYDVAAPILAKHNLDAFFFVYSSVFTENPNKLEIFRYFRTNSFSCIDDFYANFFAIVAKELEGELPQFQKVYARLDYLSAFPFYSKNDKWFRYLRDQVLSPSSYEKIMLDMMSEMEFLPQSIAKDLWMSKRDLKDLAMRGHLIGLHSHDHPTQMSKLSFDEQYYQYRRNFAYLYSIVGDVVSMSHPCGDYNEDTLKIVENLDLKIGFRSSLTGKVTGGKFEVPRDDHANILREMRNES